MLIDPVLHDVGALPALSETPVDGPHHHFAAMSISFATVYMLTGAPWSTVWRRAAQ